MRSCFAVLLAVVAVALSGLLISTRADAYVQPQVIRNGCKYAASGKDFYTSARIIVTKDTCHRNMRDVAQCRTIVGSVDQVAVGVWRTNVGRYSFGECAINNTAGIVRNGFQYVWYKFVIVGTTGFWQKRIGTYWF